MIDSHKINYSKLETLNVSRETFLELDEFKEMILYENKRINLISQHTELIARDRHIIDCAQNMHEKFNYFAKLFLHTNK